MADNQREAKVPEGAINQECVDCHREFYITVKEQEFYKGKGWTLPKRCFNCRQKRKANENN